LSLELACSRRLTVEPRIDGERTAAGDRYPPPRRTGDCARGITLFFEELPIPLNVPLCLDLGRLGLSEVRQCYAVFVCCRIEGSLGLRKICAGLIECHFVVGRVNISKRIPLFHVIGVFDTDVDDGSFDSRANRINMAVNLRVVSPFV
jgi:hypothetical protein